MEKELCVSHFIKQSLLLERLGRGFLERVGNHFSRYAFVQATERAKRRVKSVRGDSTQLEAFLPTRLSHYVATASIRGLVCAVVTVLR